MNITSLFTPVKDAAVSAYQHVKTVVSSVFTNDVAPAITTFLHVLETNGGSALIQLALATVLSAEAGTPFGVLTSTLIASAEAQGIKVAEIAAKSALQVAQTNLQAQLDAKTAATPALPAAA
jgi:hypothetical protein